MIIFIDENFVIDSQVCVHIRVASVLLNLVSLAHLLSKQNRGSVLGFVYLERVSINKVGVGFLILWTYVPDKYTKSGECSWFCLLR